MSERGSEIPDLVLLTGATGYVGGRLVLALERQSVRLRCMARRPEWLQSRLSTGTEVVRGDVLDAASLDSTLEGVGIAYYLVHSMASGGAFEAEDRAAAAAFGAAARRAGVRRIIYLGGLGHGADLSTHLASRHEVGRILRESGVPTLEFRASIVIGSGSASFEMVRNLVEKLPVMTTPRWVRTPTQPIAIEDLIAYLIEALGFTGDASEIFEIGGRDVVTYAELMREYGRQKNLRRFIVPVPVLTPWLSSLWLGLITPLYARVGRALIDGVRNPTVVRDARALQVFAVRPRGVHDAIARAVKNEDREFASTRWSDALSSVARSSPYGGTKYGSRLVDSRRLRVAAPPAAVFAVVCRVGGDRGWYYGNRLWRLRGFLDLLVGGAGMRRGRRDPEHLRVGDTVDWWRVEAVEDGRLLRLAAEMRLPGRAWLQFEIDLDGTSGSTLRQTALFDPRGLGGLVYWYSLWPLHQYVFAGMLRAMARAVQTEPAPASHRSPAL